MATYDDFDGVWFTVSSVLLHHPEIADRLSFVVIDNHPTSRVSATLKMLETRIPNYRYVPFRAYTGTMVRDQVFREACADIVCCVDAHVLLRPGALAALLRYFEDRPGTRDLVQGPLMAPGRPDRLATHLDPEWGAAMFGRWADNGLAGDFDERPYELESQGLGVFACRRDAWPGLNPLMRGFGSEEGYLHERVRRGGGATVGLPALAWVHRFHRPLGTPYPNQLEARMRNYEIAWAELGWDLRAGRVAFAERGLSARAAARARAAVDNPLNAVDAVMAINDDNDPEGWVEAQNQARAHDIEWRLERVSTSRGDSSEPGWRTAVRRARQRGLDSVLVLEPGARLDRDEVRRLAAGAEPEWQLLGLGPGAMAVRASAFDRVLRAGPGFEELPTSLNEPA